MRSEPTLKAIAFAITVLGAAFTCGCDRDRPSIDGSRLDLAVLGAKSQDEIEDKIRKSLLNKYSLTNVAEGYSIFHVTNRTVRWVFVQAANAPRGLSMFTLYCYEWNQPDLLLLRGYVPVFVSEFTNGQDWSLRFEADKNYVNTIFRGEIIFTIASDKGAVDRSEGNRIPPRGIH
jgi:hypothetical protein